MLEYLLVNTCNHEQLLSGENNDCIPEDFKFFIISRLSETISHHIII